MLTDLEDKRRWEGDGRCKEITFFLHSGRKERNNNKIIIQPYSSAESCPLLGVNSPKVKRVPKDRSYPLLPTFAISVS